MNSAQYGAKGFASLQGKCRLMADDINSVKNRNACAQGLQTQLEI